jgi:hypothetical protein
VHCPPINFYSKSGGLLLSLGLIRLSLLHHPNCVYSSHQRRCCKQRLGGVSFLEGKSVQHGAFNRGFINALPSRDDEADLIRYVVNEQGHVALFTLSQPLLGDDKRPHGE